ncbi:hypothetical protein DFQ27_001457 [Actinomortierella ambigua]|uniref:Lytic polysaccharide monooxygenase n=1 Tax=Actinomortierella ambigua TaxID=1343610 RepID=A0A9P6UCR6_9FUNG|nr:hypothetical protein DFQ27_001457 [Actinomortierella ambigua]
MKSLASIILFLATFVAVVSAHGALLFPTPRGGYRTKGYNGRVHAFLGYRDKVHSLTYPCGGFPPVPPTPMRAGQRIDVRFAVPKMPDRDFNKQPKKPSSGKQMEQARHGGGFCEFSLSYDNGKTFYTIARYSRTCPDAYYLWPVRIPPRAPSCTRKGQCLFVWTWTAHILDQFYMNCADITLRGSSKPNLKRVPIQMFDFRSKLLKKQPQLRITAADGDGGKTKAGPGPNPNEIRMNLKNQLPPLPKFKKH